MRRSAILILAALALACASPPKPTSRYSPPDPIEVRNAILVLRPFSETWNHLIGQLAQSFFLINNVEKESRIINLPFSTDVAEKHLECGQPDRTYRGQAYNYATAGDSRFMSGGSWGQYNNLPFVQHAVRKTSLEGRVNVSWRRRKEARS